MAFKWKIEFKDIQSQYGSLLTEKQKQKNSLQPDVINYCTEPNSVLRVTSLRYRGRQAGSAKRNAYKSNNNDKNRSTHRISQPSSSGSSKKLPHLRTQNRESRKGLLWWKNQGLEVTWTKEQRTNQTNQQSRWWKMRNDRGPSLRSPRSAKRKNELLLWVGICICFDWFLGCFLFWFINKYWSWEFLDTVFSSIQLHAFLFVWSGGRRCWAGANKFASSAA